MPNPLLYRKLNGFGGGSSVDSVSLGLSWYYKFNGSSIRSYGTNNAGDSNVTYVAGKVGQAAYFSGTDSFMQIDPSTDFSLGGSDFTILLWVKPAVVDARQILLGQSDWTVTTSTISFYAQITDTNTFQFVFKKDGEATFVTCTSTTTAVAGTWYWLSIKRTGGNLYFKVNNSLEDTKSIAWNIQASAYRMGIACIGEYKGALLYNGSVDIFCGWKRALTDAEETYLYNGGSGLEFNGPSVVNSTNPLQEYFIDCNSIGFSTFQDHSQHICVTQYGIFALYWKTRPNEGSSTWNFVRSTDEGVSWTMLHSAAFAYVEPPTIENDAAGNIYIFNNDSATTTKLYKVLISDFTTLIQIANITGIDAHKHTSMLDETNNRFYYLVRNVMTVLNMSGTILSQNTILQAGSTAGEEYPFFMLNPNGSGELCIAWVTAVVNTNGNYKTINFMLSRDLCVTYELPDGTPLSIPITSDNTGPTQMITLVGDISTNKFISGYTWSNGRLHFKYWLDDPAVRERYVRINPTTGVVEVSIDLIFPSAGTSSINLTDGALVRTLVDGTPGSPAPIYAFGSIEPKLACIRSLDNGVTWTNYIERDQDLQGRNYAVSADRTTHNGKCYGVFTSVSTDPSVVYGAKYSGFTYFFKLTS